jgi:hypothetical protein
MQRHQSQLQFLASNREIEVGDVGALPLPLKQLLLTTADSDYVSKKITSGLTAHIYKIHSGGKDWTLKLARDESLVRNVDGLTSFLNEVQRRQDFQSLKANPATSGYFRHVVTTQYASFRRGVILSPWIVGRALDIFNEQVLTQLFDTLVNFELHGFIEWDLCPGNILFDGADITLFDFGYCYPFDPLTEYNSSGLELPLFHSIERLETRNFFAFLLLREHEWKHAELMALYELEKHLALEVYQRKYFWLRQHGASETVLSWKADILKRWREGLSNQANLEDLYLLESWRSHVLDVGDDLHGKTCTAMTLKRLDALENILHNHFGLLQKMDGLFFGDEKLSQTGLLQKIRRQRLQAVTFLLPVQ